MPRHEQKEIPALQGGEDVNIPRCPALRAGSMIPAPETERRYPIMREKPERIWRGRKRGFTLLETVLVVAVGLSLLVGGIMFYSTAEREMKLRDLRSRTVLVAEEARTLFKTRPGFGRRDWTEDVMAISSLPEDYFTGLQVWFPTGATDFFEIRLSDLPEKVCTALATHPEYFGRTFRQEGSSCRGQTGDRVHLAFGL